MAFLGVSRNGAWLPRGPNSCSKGTYTRSLAEVRSLSGSEISGLARLFARASSCLRVVASFNDTTRIFGALAPAPAAEAL